jgi:hypothetical protein
MHEMGGRSGLTVDTIHRGSRYWIGGSVREKFLGNVERAIADMINGIRRFWIFISTHRGKATLFLTNSCLYS